MANNEMMANVRGGALVGAGFGGIIGAVIGWLMGAHMVAVPVVGPVVGQGVLSTALVAAVAGVAAGALLGGLVGVFSRTPDLEAAEESSLVPQSIPADTVVAGGPVVATLPSPLVTAQPVAPAELEAEQLLYPTAGIGIATPDAAVNPFAPTLEHQPVVTHPVDVIVPSPSQAEEQIAPLSAAPIEAAAPVVEQAESAVAPVAPTPPETLPLSGSWVTFDPGPAPQESIDTATNTPNADALAEVEPGADPASTPAIRVRRRRRIAPEGVEESPDEQGS